MAAFLLYFVVLISMAVVGQSCKCALSQPQAVFCYSDFVIRAKVINQSLENHKRVFTVKIGKVFIGQLNGVNSFREKLIENRTRNFVKIYTSIEGAACGVQLLNRTEYVLAGSIRNSKMNINRCSFPLIKEWWKVTSIQRRAFKRSLYKDNCKCQVGGICFGPNCGTKLKGCDKPDQDYAKTVCKEKYSYCVKKSPTTCKWKKTRQYENCLSGEQ